jgi:hypothetical protein
LLSGALSFPKDITEIECKIPSVTITRRRPAGGWNGQSADCRAHSAGAADWRTCNTAAAANTYLRDVFLPDFNNRFGVVASEAGTAYITYTDAARAFVHRHRYDPLNQLYPWSSQ